MAHVGLTPQSAHALGGYRVQGVKLSAAQAIVDGARAQAAAGAFAIVLELVPAGLARAITEHLEIPTIGIGAGPYCDGQIQVLHGPVRVFRDDAPAHARLCRRCRAGRKRLSRLCAGRAGQRVSGAQPELQGQPRRGRSPEVRLIQRSSE